MRIRYVIGRAAMPKAPRRLKGDKLSTAKEQDSMAGMGQRKSETWSSYEEIVGAESRIHCSKTLSILSLNSPLPF